MVLADFDIEGASVVQDVLFDRWLFEEYKHACVVVSFLGDYHADNTPVVVIRRGLRPNVRVRHSREGCLKIVDLIN